MEIQKNTKDRQEADGKMMELLDILDEVGMHFPHSF
jgi:hypothetical protein